MVTRLLTHARALPNTDASPFTQRTSPRRTLQPETGALARAQISVDSLAIPSSSASPASSASPLRAPVQPPSADRIPLPRSVPARGDATRPRDAHPFLQAPRDPDLPEEQLTLLVVDDDLLHAKLLKANLERPGRLKVEVAGSGEQAMQRITAGPVDAVLTDLAMPEIDGLELVRQIRAGDVALPVIIMTAHASIAAAVDGIRAGATDFLPKPVNPDALIAFVERAVLERPVREALLRDRERARHSSFSDYIVGHSKPLDEVRSAARRIAESRTSRVLLVGESGTGKSLMARAIHDLSGDGGRLLEVNCASFPPGQLEVELFGRERGVFPEAHDMKRGMFELADRGTLILDDVDALSLPLQATLLQVLEHGEIRRVGGTQPVKVRVRVIACSSVDLSARSRNGHFREELLYRLDVARITMPVLREMPQVVRDLVPHFVKQICEGLNRPVPVVDERCVRSLMEYHWPGNGRELRNAVERALIFHRSGPLAVCEPPVEWDLPEEYAGARVRDWSGVQLQGTPDATDDLRIPRGLSLADVERRYIAATIEGHPSDYGTLAEQLGISRKTLWKKRMEYGL